MDSSEAHLLTSDTDDGILVVTLNRPDKLNALSSQTMALFEQALHRFRDSDQLKVLLIRAFGRYFSAGADVREAQNLQAASDSGPMTARGIRENHRIRNRGMQRIYDEMEHIEKPIVAAHQRQGELCERMAAK